MKALKAAAVFPVSDVDQSLKFYTEVLGFEEDFRFGNYAGVKRGEAHIHLSSGEGKNKPLGSGNAYVFCDEVDEYYKLIISRRAQTEGEPIDEPYGMRDFYCVDPDGNQIGFGKILS